MYRKLLASSTATKVLATVAALGATTALAGLGTYATFTSTVSQSQTISSGTVTIALGATGAATNRLNITATNIVPGDTIQRSFDLTNSGTAGLASIALTTSATTSSLLDTDATNGLQMVVDRCSLAWVETGPPYTYTCGGSTTSIIATRAVIGSGLSMAGLSALTAGGTDHLRATLTFPSATTGGTFQNLTSVISYSFTGTQRSGTNQ